MFLGYCDPSPYIHNFSPSTTLLDNIKQPPEYLPSYSKHSICKCFTYLVKQAVRNNTIPWTPYLAQALALDKNFSLSIHIHHNTGFNYARQAIEIILTSTSPQSSTEVSALVGHLSEAGDALYLIDKFPDVSINHLYLSSFLCLQPTFF